MPSDFAVHAQLVSARHPKSRTWFYPEHHDLIWSAMRPENSKSMRFGPPPEWDDIDDVGPIPIQRAEIKELWMIPEMPVDILYEVFNHLHPIDLLGLSRTTRSLREIVTSRQSKHMWRSSLASVQALPPCPPDLTEIQYASLAFDNYCHFCTAPVHEVFWICRVRCCTKCIPKYFRSEDEIGVWVPENVIVDKPDLIFPYIPQGAHGNEGKSALYFFPAVEECLRELNVVLLMKDDDALSKWIQKKKDIQTLRVLHARYCDTFWNYRRPRRSLLSNHSEERIVMVLVLVLAFLWKDYITSMVL